MPPPNSPNSARPTGIACLECRKTHLRCDGSKPICERCASRGLHCIYTTSKRGQRRGTQRVNNRLRSTASATPSHSSPPRRTHPDCRPGTNGVTATVGPPDCVRPSPHSEILSIPLLITSSHIQHSEPSTRWADDFQLVNLYYVNFHPNHPILVPRDIYWKRDYPWYLKAVVEFIGSHFSGAQRTRDLQEDAANELQQTGESVPAIVQARILQALMLLAQNNIRACQELSAQAIASAIDQGMHRQNFASLHAKGQPEEEEESLRRTWYELYVLDGVVAAFQRNVSFRSATVDADVFLPSEENVYNNPVSTALYLTRHDFEISTFMDEDAIFSSFCYRIEAVRLLERVLAITGCHGVGQERVQAIDNALAAFLHHLPTSKREPEIISIVGEVDGLMFQTHMVIQYATILLHFPRADLHLTPSIADIPGGCTSKFVCPCSRQHVHSVKAMDASRALTMLAALRIPAQKYTPLFAFPLVLCAVVHFSLYLSHVGRCDRLETHRDSIKLVLGVLKSMSQYWLSAGMFRRALKKRALRIFVHSRGSFLGTANADDSTNGSTPARPPVNEHEVSLNDTIQAEFGAFMDFDGLFDLNNGSWWL